MFHAKVSSQLKQDKHRSELCSRNLLSVYFLFVIPHIKSIFKGWDNLICMYYFFIKDLLLLKKELQLSSDEECTGHGLFCYVPQNMLRPKAVFFYHWFCIIMQKENISPVKCYEKTVSIFSSQTTVTEPV